MRFNEIVVDNKRLVWQDVTVCMHTQKTCDLNPCQFVIVTSVAKTFDLNPCQLESPVGEASGQSQSRDSLQILLHLILNEARIPEDAIPKSLFLLVEDLVPVLESA